MARLRLFLRCCHRVCNELTRQLQVAGVMSTTVAVQSYASRHVCQLKINQHKKSVTVSVEQRTKTLHCTIFVRLGQLEPVLQCLKHGLRRSFRCTFGRITWTLLVIGDWQQDSTYTQAGFTNQVFWLHPHTSCLNQSNFSTFSIIWVFAGLYRKFYMILAVMTYLKYASADILYQNSSLEQKNILK